MWKLPRAKRVPKTSSKRSSLMVWFPSPPSPSHSRLYSIDSHRISLFRKHGGKSMESSVVSHAGSQAEAEEKNLKREGSRPTSACGWRVGLQRSGYLATAATCVLI